MTAKPTRIGRDNLTRRERQALRKLQRRTDMIMKPADKGSGTVVMNRQNYLDECYRQHFYKKIEEDPTEQINRRVRFLPRQATNRQHHR